MNGNIHPGFASKNGYAAIQQALEEELSGLRPGQQPENQRLKRQEILALQYTASQSILELLKDRGVAGAEIVAERLTEEIKKDPGIDMGVIADQYEDARAIKNGTDEEAELEKLSRLARVVDATALAAVMGNVGGVYASSMVVNAREVMMQHAGHIGADATDIVGGLLDGIELQASTREPEN
jgi:hypothetical protein